MAERELWETADQGEATHCAASVYGSEYVPVKRVPAGAVLIEDFDAAEERMAEAEYERDYGRGWETHAPADTKRAYRRGAAWRLHAAVGKEG